MAFTDDFTGTNGDTLESRSGWTRVDGSAGAGQVDSNALKGTTATNTAYTHDAGATDKYVQANWSVASGNPGFMCVRLTDANNFVGFRRLSSAREVYKRVSGSFTLLFQTSGTQTGVYRLEVASDSFDLFRDGTPFAENPVASDTTLAAETKCGVVVRDTSTIFDDYEQTEAAGGANPHGPLGHPFHGPFGGPV